MEKNIQSTSGVHKLTLKLFIFAALCALPVWGVAQMVREMNFIWPACIYVLVSTITFWFYWNDKRRAQTGRRRFTENSLHLMALLGGWPGALLAQQLFRHKTRKLSFQFISWLIVMLHLAFWLDWVWFRGEHASLVLMLLMGR